MFNSIEEWHDYLRKLFLDMAIEKVCNQAVLDGKLPSSTIKITTVSDDLKVGCYVVKDN